MGRRGAVPQVETKRPVIWLELDLGDTEITLKEYPDGKFSLEAPAGEDGRLILEGAQVAEVAGAFVAVAQAKGWMGPRRKKR